MKTLFVVLLTATATSIMRGQAVSNGPNRLGLDIEKVTVNPQDSTVRVVFRNKATLPVTAYVVNVASDYSNGEQLNHETTLDFFESLGLERLDSPDQPKGAIPPNATRVSSFMYRKSAAPGASLQRVRVTVSSVMFQHDIIYTDDSARGHEERIKDIFSKRDAHSTEVRRWCSSLDQISGVRFTRKSLTDFIESHFENTRNSLVATLLEGIEWGADGKGVLRPAAAELINAKCSAAKEYAIARNLDQP